MILIVRRNEDSEKIRVPDGIPSGTRIFSESSFLLTINNIVISVIINVKVVLMRYNFLYCLCVVI